jgi:hypothetical protein
MDYINDIGRFLWAVINNWAGYTTGGVLVALLWLWTTFRQIPLSRKIGIGVAVIFLFFAVFNAWRDQRKGWEQERAESIRLQLVRPYAVIEELAPEQVRSMALRSSTRLNDRTDDSSRAYVFVADPRGNSFLYFTVRCLAGSSVPAHNFHYYASLSILHKGGNEETMRLNAMGDSEGDQDLLPGQFVVRQLELPSGSVINPHLGDAEKANIALVVTYSGKEGDRNTYYHRVVLQVSRVTSVGQMNRGIGGIMTKSTKEGIVKSIDELLK